MGERIEIAAGASYTGPEVIADGALDHLTGQEIPLTYGGLGGPRCGTAKIVKVTYPGNGTAGVQVTCEVDPDRDGLNAAAARAVASRIADMRLGPVAWLIPEVPASWRPGDPLPDDYQPGTL